MTGKSSLDMAREYEARLEHYLAHVEVLPARNGKLNVSAVAAACGFDRQILYKNRNARSLIEAAVHAKGLTGIEDAGADSTGNDPPEAMVALTRLREEQRRVALLERRLSEMTARNAALRARLRQQCLIEDHLIAAGRRSRPTGAGPLFEEPGE